MVLCIIENLKVKKNRKREFWNPEGFFINELKFKNVKFQNLEKIFISKKLKGTNFAENLYYKILFFKNPRRKFIVTINSIRKILS